MNAEDCLLHRPYIDVPGPEGIYYPWVCECPDPPACNDPECDGRRDCRGPGWIDPKDEWGYGPDGEIVDLR